jgi:aspartyl protease family protein
MKDFPQSLKYLTVWLLVMGGLIIIVMQVFQQQEERRVRKLSVEEGGGVAIERRYNHYHLQGIVSSKGASAPVNFLVDTGASTVLISGELARKLNLKKGPNATFETASGRAEGYFTTADIELPGLTIVRDHRVAVLEDAGREPLLGMDILKRFELVQSGKTLTIKPMLAGK